MLPPEIVRLDYFELDLARYELHPGDRVIKLEKNPMELLILLAENPGGLVTRDQIIGRLWGDYVFVDRSHGVNTAIHKLRNVLGDESEQPRILETVVGKGYRPLTKLAATTRHDISPHADNDNPLPDAGLYPLIGQVKKPNLGELSASDPFPEDLDRAGERIS